MPLTLSLLGKYLSLAFTGDIRQFGQIDWAEADAETKEAAMLFG